jgi:hypothetical protein
VFFVLREILNTKGTKEGHEGHKKGNFKVISNKPSTEKEKAQRTVVSQPSVF